MNTNDTFRTDAEFALLCRSALDAGEQVRFDTAVARQALRIQAEQGVTIEAASLQSLAQTGDHLRQAVLGRVAQ